jgi:hypothetical protein
MPVKWGGETEKVTIQKMNCVKSGNLLFLNYNMTPGDARVPPELWLKILWPPTNVKANLSCEMASPAYFVRMEKVRQGISLCADGRSALQWLLRNNVNDEERLIPIDAKKVDQAWGKLDTVQRERCERVLCYLLAFIEDECEKKGICHTVYMNWSSWAQVLKWEHHQVILNSHNYIWLGLPMPNDHTMNEATKHLETKLSREALMMASAVSAEEMDKLQQEKNARHKLFVALLGAVPRCEEQLGSGTYRMDTWGEGAVAVAGGASKASAKKVLMWSGLVERLVLGEP